MWCERRHGPLIFWICQLRMLELRLSMIRRCAYLGLVQLGRDVWAAIIRIPIVETMMAHMLAARRPMAKTQPVSIHTPPQLRSYFAEPASRTLYSRSNLKKMIQKTNKQLARTAPSKTSIEASLFLRGKHTRLRGDHKQRKYNILKNRVLACIWHVSGTLEPMASIRFGSSR